MKRTSNEDVSGIPGNHVMDYAPVLGMREKNTLFGGSERVGGNNGLTGMDIHLRVATVGTIAASTCSLCFVVSDVPSRRRSGRTRMNNTKTDGPSVSPC